MPLSLFLAAGIMLGSLLMGLGGLIYFVSKYHKLALGLFLAGGSLVLVTIVLFFLVINAPM